MRITPTEFFVPRWTCFWATAYQFDPLLFEQFLLRRLGEPPLNVTLLLDAEKLTETWAAMTGGEQWRLQRAGCDYLIRGVKLGGSFHAKTYFFGNARDGLLLVGSGNLTLQGLEQGHEVFSSFSSTDDQGLAVIQSWRDWMQELIGALSDDDVHRRWWDLRKKTRWLTGQSSQSIFVSNTHASMLSQLRADLPSAVDEVHALAPFMDQHATALEELVNTTHPGQLHVYIGQKLSVDGLALSKVLQRLRCEVKLWRFEPDSFVHAKLIGVIWGDHGRLLSGSANLSRAAMTVSHTAEHWANIEADILVSASADAVRAAFCPPDLSLHPLSEDGIKALSYQQPVRATLQYRYFIQFARRLTDEHIEIAVQPTLSPETQVHLTDGTVRAPLASNQTAERFPVGERAVLVWLEDNTGTQISNMVALDNPQALAGWLQERNQLVDKPRELDITDLETPIGALLQRLHRACIFDMDETNAVGHAQRALDSSDSEEADPAFWDRLVQEELALDPRTAPYQRFAAGLPAHEDEVLLLLREMLDRTPAHRLLSEASKTSHESIHEEPSVTPWTPTRRLQVRLFHVLERWVRALNDPRLRWINPIAPVRNYEALLAAIAGCWENAYLPEPELLSVLQSLFESFITGKDAPGYLLSIDQLDRDTAVARMQDDARSLASALVYVALRPNAHWQNHVFSWQAFLIAGIELGIFQAPPSCSAVIEKLGGAHVSATAIEDRLLELAEYTDDAHWCATIQKELDLGSVAFRADTFAPPFNVVLAVRGIFDPLLDPRLVALIRRTFQYKRVPGLVIMGQDWRLSVADKKLARVRLPNGATLRSTEKITRSSLTSLEQQRLGLSNLFSGDQRAIS